jgi:nitroreductase
MLNINSLIADRFGGEWSKDGATNETMETLLQHRTHRAFLTKEIEPEVLAQSIAGAFSAPSKSDLQQTSIIHIKSPEKRETIAALIPTMPWIGTCPEFLIFCADGRRIQRICEVRGKPFANDNLDNLIAAVCDTGLAMQAFISAAESLGLGCCPISVIRDHMEAIAEIAKLPERVIPIAGMCIGYPSREGFVSMRLPLGVSCHTDSYDDSDLEQLVDSYDQARDARFSLPVDRQKYKKQYGVADYYGWSEDKARQMSVEERANVGTYVRDHGFSLL